MYILAPEMDILAPKMDKSLPIEKVQPQWQLLYLFSLRVYVLVIYAMCGLKSQQEFIFYERENKTATAQIALLF